MTRLRAIPTRRRAAPGIASVVMLAVVLSISVVRAQPIARPRIALVVGVSAYKSVPALANPVNDARAFAAALVRLGFDVDAVLDPNRAVLEAAVRRLGQRARGADVAVMFYAGHALEVGGHNWLLPIETNPGTERDLRYEALDFDGLLEQLDGGAPITVVLIDACRDNPFRLRFSSGGRGVTPGGGLAPARAATGTLIAFGTAPGMVAEDGAGPNSPFTTALLRHIEQPGLEIRRLMADVRREVRETTRGRQVPWEHSALEGEFYFKPAPAQVKASPAAAALPAPGPDAELIFWQGVRDSTDLADLRAFLTRFPDGLFADIARNRLTRLGAGPAVAAAAPRPLLDRLLPALDRTGDRVTAPFSALWSRVDAQSYVAERTHKAIAVEWTSGRLFRFVGAPSTEIADQLALEGCQFSYAIPCVLVASDDDMRSSDPRVSARSGMPRIVYQGEFRPDMVPMTRIDALPDAVQRYSAQAGPKALAMRAINRRLTMGSGATQAVAEATALATCNAEPSPVPCVLYASGNRVILPQRRTEPLLADGPTR